MPFKYELTLGDSIAADEQIEFVSWIEEVWEKYHEERVPYAIAKGPKGPGNIVINGPCVLLQRSNLQAGDQLSSNTVIGMAAADRESIPYAKPYSDFVYHA